MNLVSVGFDEKVRKTESAMLQALATAGQVHVADAMGTSDSTVSRMKDGQLLVIAKFLTACGLKVVRQDEITIDPAQLSAVETLFKSAVAKTGMADLLQKVTS